jgi:hypothetical protein
VDEFIDNLSAPPKGMVGAGKTQEYRATRAGGSPGSETTRHARAMNPPMAEAYRLHHLLLAANAYHQYLYVSAFNKGSGIAEHGIRIRRHAIGDSGAPSEREPGPK